MEAFVPALVAALLAGLGDRPAWRMAILGDVHDRPFPTLSGFLVVLLIANGVAVAGGMLVAPMLSPKAGTLLLGVALMSAGGAALLPIHLAKPRTSARFGPFASALLSQLPLAIGDRSVFITFALAARSAAAWPAGAGATIGGIALGVAALSIGEAGWRSAPVRRAAIAAGLALMVTGGMFIASGLRLI